MFRQYRNIAPGEYLLCALDTAQGGGDSTAMQVLSHTYADVPIVYESEESTDKFIPGLSRFLEAVADSTGVRPLIAPERQNGGMFLAERLSEMNMSGKYKMFKMPTIGKEEHDKKEPTRLGWDTNGATRPKMLQELQTAVDRSTLIVYDTQTLRQCLSFIKTRSGRPEAEKLKHDDLVLSLAIAWQLYQLTGPPEVLTHLPGGTAQPAKLPDFEILDDNGFY